MPPSAKDLVLVQHERDCYLAPEIQEIEQIDHDALEKPYEMKIVWLNVLKGMVMHAAAIRGLYFMIYTANPLTNLWALFVTLWAGVAVTGGAHRLWSHRSYKANFGVKLFYVFGVLIAGQNDVIEWARDHRAHHKWTDTDADPHNFKRGFYFAHIGWLSVRKHPKVKEMGSKIDMSDLQNDPLLAFQQKYYLILVNLAFASIVAVPWLWWGESLEVSTFIVAGFRWVSHLHLTWSINSFAHWIGDRPFDKNISAVNNYICAIFAYGEGWHNYHHTFPQDYRSSEYGWDANSTTMLIDFFANNGWVWDRKTMSAEALERQKAKGDGSAVKKMN